MHLNTKLTFSCSFPAIFESLAETIFSRFASFSSVYFSGELVKLREGGESGHLRNAPGSNSELAPVGAISFFYLTIYGWWSRLARSC
jgi:hypothetical protein